jgi:hypothetical protein
VEGVLRESASAPADSGRRAEERRGWAMRRPAVFLSSGKFLKNLQINLKEVSAKLKT